MKKTIIFLLLISSFNITASPITYYNSGNQAYDEGDLFGAVEAYKTAIFLNNEYGEAYAKLGLIFFILQEYDEALSYLDDAVRLLPDKTNIKTLLGRVYVGLGRLEEAEALYADLQEREPYNIEVAMGLGEIYTAQGDLTKASERFSYTLSLSPQNRRALLSLALIFRYQDRPQASQQLIELALQYHGDNPLVQLNAGRHYYQLGLLDEAIGYIERASRMQPGSPAPLLVLGGIFLEKKDFERVVEIMDTVITLDPENYLAWYTRGVGYYNLGNIEKGVQSLSRALIIRPDDEITRFSLEEISLRHFEEKSELRTDLADYHIKEAKRRLEAFYNESALQSLRTALRLYPHHSDARRSLADLLKDQGYTASYYEELELITKLDENTQDVQELLELTGRRRRLLLHSDWEVDQFSLEFNSIKCSIASSLPASGMDHPGAEDFLLQQLGRQIESTSMFDLVNLEPNLSSADIFEISRYDGSEYFFHFTFLEGESSFSIEATVFLSRTGTNLGTIQVTKSGNNSISRAMVEMSQRLSQLFTFRGEIIQRKFKMGLVNLGKFHGFEIGDQFLIIKNGFLRLDNTSVGYLYNTNRVVGQGEIIRLDDYVSEIEISIEGFYDEVNPMDHVIPLVEEEKSQKENDNDGLVIYKDILTIY